MRLGKKLFDLGTRYGTYLPVERIRIAEVVPNHRTAGGKNVPDLPSNGMGEAVVEDRAEHGEDENEIETFWRKRSFRGIAHVKENVGLALARLRNTFGKEVDAHEVFRLSPSLGHAGEGCSRSTAYVQNAKGGKRPKTMLA